jgi:hypothetical protein
MMVSDAVTGNKTSEVHSYILLKLYSQPKNSVTQMEPAVFWDMTPRRSILTYLLSRLSLFSVFRAVQEDYIYQILKSCKCRTRTVCCYSSCHRRKDINIFSRYKINAQIFLSLWSRNVATSLFGLTTSCRFA